MAQTKRKRRRKHRGTQGGKIDDRPRGRPRNRAEARSRAQSKRGKARSGKRTAAQAPPTWSSAIFKGGVAAALFFLLLAVLFKKPVGPSVGLAAFMLLFYIPMSYYTDRYFYSRRQRQAQKDRAERDGDR